ncbi:MAG: hypothetical protein K0B11_13220 [Mariniphaga sp.]|nr:hypothetical protein [Mariniphaga sp.]
MDEKLIRDYMEASEARLQKLEDNLIGKQEPKKTEENSKEKGINEFIEFLKKTNATPEPEPGNDENFIKMMKDINKK